MEVNDVIKDEVVRYQHIRKHWVCDNCGKRLYGKVVTRRQDGKELHWHPCKCGVEYWLEHRYPLNRINLLSPEE